MDSNTEPTLLIREAIPADIAQLARLRWDSRLEDQSAQPRAAFLEECETWLRDALASRRWIIAVAASGLNDLAGCMFLQCVEKVPAPGATPRAWGYLTNSFVDPEHRGHGIGQKLLQLLIDAAHNRRLEFLIVWPSEGAVAFYRRAGFRPVSEAHAGANDDEPPLELMLSIFAGTS